jgi:hypothetical protein
VILNNGLEEMGAWAFCRCMSLICIKIPPAIRAIKEGVFFDCSGMRAAISNNDLEEIGVWAFHGCKSLVHIKIPIIVHNVLSFLNSIGAEDTLVSM